MDIYHFTPGDRPLLISVPHSGTYIPEAMKERMTDAGLAVADTDWYVDRLYDFAEEMGVGLLVATHSRYVVDLNRDPTGTELYPGADNTELCPTTTFGYEDIYRTDLAPNSDEVSSRIERYWRPYHDALRRELGRLQERFGRALLLDGHSIPSRVPRFFDGVLPDLNLGSGGQTTADQELVRRLGDSIGRASGFTSVVDGRFKGGFITRTFGQPAEGVHAVQMELTQANYMKESHPYEYLPERAEDLKNVLREFVVEMLRWAEDDSND